ncbi:MAG: F0F1 ATP synthase subunit B' [Proteobacteria bacterium]|nr:F0F1 ATP synthase subunit B' [Pseudomonadota bacterium]
MQAEAAHPAEATTAFPPFDASLFPSQLFWFALSFIALYVIMSRFVLPKVGATLARRAGTIDGDLDQAAQKSAEAENARASMEKAVAKARADARAMIDAARAEVQAKLNAEQEAADARIAERIRAAEARVETAKQKALAEVPALADGLARDIADRIAPAVAAPARQRVAAGEA